MRDAVTVAPEPERLNVCVAESVCVRVGAGVTVTDLLRLIVSVYTNPAMEPQRYPEFSSGMPQNCTIPGGQSTPEQLHLQCVPSGIVVMPATRLLQM